MAQEEQQGTVRLVLGGQSVHMDGFEPSVEGVSAIGCEPVEVPANKAQEVKDAAARSGVTIEEVS